MLHHLFLTNHNIRNTAIPFYCLKIDVLTTIFLVNECFFEFVIIISIKSPYLFLKTGNGYYSVLNYFRRTVALKSSSSIGNEISSSVEPKVNGLNVLHDTFEVILLVPEFAEILPIFSHCIIVLFQ